MKKEQKKEFTGVWIPRHIIEDDDLSMTERFIYSEIACFEVCFKSNERLGERYNLKKNTISIIVSKLIKKGYIVSNQKTGEYRQLVALKDKPNQTGCVIKIKEPLSEKSKSLCDKNQTIDNNKEYIEKTTNIADKSASNEINLILNEFKSLNPLIKFGNTTERKAVETLLKEYGFEKTTKMIRLYKERMSDKFCPVATKPTAFVRKMGEIAVYFAKLKANQPKTIVL